MRVAEGAGMNHLARSLTVATVLFFFDIACSPELAAPDPLAGIAFDDAAAQAPLTGDDAALEDDATTTIVGDDAGTPVVAEPEASTVVAWPEAAAPSGDAAPDGACMQPLGPGDLVVDELMIEAVAGAGDYGEWVEMASALPCVVNLRGLHGETSDASKVRTFDVAFDLWIPPGATIVVADSPDPTLNHSLPGVVLAWAAHPGDVLRNEGGTLTIRMGDAIVDSVTWPAYKLGVGASVELAADCPRGVAGDFARWQPAVASWFPGFRGTPNGPNTDVTCPP
jgi:hypothetical protein